MKANEFFKAMGYKSVKQFIKNDNIRTNEMSNELKRLVESWELVESLGGLDEAKEEYQARIQNNEPTCGLAKTIEDVESCQ